MGPCGPHCRHVRHIELIFVPNPAFWGCETSDNCPRGGRMPFVLTISITCLIGASIGALLCWIMLKRAAPDPPSETELQPVALPQTPGRAADALVLLDVDRLAELNAQFGPDIGDRTLERITDVIRRATPTGAAYERLDGGRYVVWLSEMDVNEAAAFADELRALTPRASIDVGGRRIGRTLSAGVVPLLGSEGRARALMAAQGALRRAKKQGGDRVVRVTTPDQPIGPSAAEVQEAIRTGAIGYYVQPIFDLNTGRATGVEALLRWTLQDGSIMPPSSFLHRIEELPEDAAVLFSDLAVSTARLFVEGPNPINFGLNVTGRALEDEGSQSRDWLLALVDQLPAEHVVLELLESAVITNPDVALRTLAELQRKGCQIALDDFGTGLSNLDRILDVNPQTIKLDGSLVAQLGETGRAESLISGVAGMGKDLGIKVIAEGLESAADTEVVSALGVGYGQGYYLGRPHPAAYWAEKLFS